MNNCETALANGRLFVYLVYFSWLQYHSILRPIRMRGRRCNANVIE